MRSPFDVLHAKPSRVIAGFWPCAPKSRRNCKGGTKNSLVENVHQEGESGGTRDEGEHPRGLHQQVLLLEPVPRALAQGVPRRVGPRIRPIPTGGRANGRKEWEGRGGETKLERFPVDILAGVASLVEHDTLALLLCAP